MLHPLNYPCCPRPSVGILSTSFLSLPQPLLLCPVPALDLPVTVSLNCPSSPPTGVRAPLCRDHRHHCAPRRPAAVLRRPERLLEAPLRNTARGRRAAAAIGPCRPDRRAQRRPYRPLRGGGEGGGIPPAASFLHRHVRRGHAPSGLRSRHQRWRWGCGGARRRFGPGGAGQRSACGHAGPQGRGQVRGRTSSV